MKIDTCTFDQAPEILAILNEAIISSTALYDYTPRTLSNMEDWFMEKESAACPILGAFEPDGTLMGFATFGSFRAWPAYKYSIEHSIYIHCDKRGQGVGSCLMAELIDAATKGGFHMMIGGVDSSNEASVKLHRKLGFTHCGTIRHAGFKFGRWLDLDFYQLVLPTPESPNEE